MISKPLRRALCLPAFGLALVLATTPLASAQTPRPPSREPPDAAISCFYCHGQSGRPQDPTVPIIAGQNATYLSRALHDYRQGRRTGANAEPMRQVIQSLNPSDQTIEELAAFFASLRPPR